MLVYLYKNYLIINQLLVAVISFKRGFFNEQDCALNRPYNWCIFFQAVHRLWTKVS